MVWPSSQPIANVAPFSLANSTMPFFSSSTEIPTTSTLSPTRFESSSSFGNDARHGSHHVAQKSTTRTLPFDASSEIGPLPFRDSSDRSGAGFPTSAGPPPFPPSSTALLAPFSAPPQPAARAASDMNRAAPNRLGKNVMG